MWSLDVCSMRLFSSFDTMLIILCNAPCHSSNSCSTGSSSSALFAHLSVSVVSISHSARILPGLCPLPIHPPSYASLIPISSMDTWLKAASNPHYHHLCLPGMCHTAHVPSLGASPFSPSPSDDVCALTIGMCLLRMWVHVLEPWNWFWERMGNSYVWETWQLLRHKTAA